MILSLRIGLWRASLLDDLAKFNEALASTEAFSESVTRCNGTIRNLKGPSPHLTHPTGALVSNAGKKNGSSLSLRIGTSASAKHRELAVAQNNNLTLLYLGRGATKESAHEQKCGARRAHPRLVLHSGALGATGCVGDEDRCLLRRSLWPRALAEAIFKDAHLGDGPRNRSLGGENWRRGGSARA
jgi:hypothetical protein